MALPGWTHSDSPFHAGELAIQERLGVTERMDKQGRRIVREFMPDQHRRFFSQLPYVMVGTVDEQGRPWASILVGAPGFISSPDPHHLQLATQPLFGDPLAKNWVVGHDIGLLGIELHTRRRNRLNGVIEAMYPQGIEVRVGQSFGNCPQYIQARECEWVDFDPQRPQPVTEITTLAAADVALISGADTFFIATAYQAEAAGRASGVDVSHRGGKPGFVRVDAQGSLTVPDFSGNFHFNTFGNLELNPRAGLVFVDFLQGDLLYLTGQAEVIWDGPEVSEYAGAERLLRFYPELGYRVEGSLPLRWSAPEVSPFLNGTGSWPEDG